MTRILNSERKDAISGSARSAVVFLHGYGANGADLLGLADPLSEHLPDTLFIAPNAPETCPGAPFGFQWFQRRKNKYNKLVSLSEAVVVVKVDGEKKLSASESMDEIGSDRGPVNAFKIFRASFRL